MDRRSKNERTVDRLGNTRDLHSHTGSERVAAWAATHRRPRPGCESDSHCCAAAKNARQRTGKSPRLGSLVAGSQRPVSASGPGVELLCLTKAARKHIGRAHKRRAMRVMGRPYADSKCEQ